MQLSCEQCRGRPARPPPPPRPPSPPSPPPRALQLECKDTTAPETCDYYATRANCAKGSSEYGWCLRVGNTPHLGCTVLQYLTQPVSLFVGAPCHCCTSPPLMLYAPYTPRHDNSLCVQCHYCRSGLLDTGLPTSVILPLSPPRLLLLALLLLTRNTLVTVQGRRQRRRLRPPRQQPAAGHRGLVQGRRVVACRHLHRHLAWGAGVKGGRHLIHPTRAEPKVQGPLQRPLRPCGLLLSRLRYADQPCTVTPSPGLCTSQRCTRALIFQHKH